MGLIPGLGRSPGGGNGNPLQYSCLENPMDRGAWWATIHRVTKSRTRLSDYTTVRQNHSAPIVRQGFDIQTLRGLCTRGVAEGETVLVIWAVISRLPAHPSTGWTMVEDPHPGHISLATGLL